MITVRIATPVITRSVTRRRRLMGATGTWMAAVFMASDISFGGLSASYAPDQQLRQSIHDNGHQKQRQADLYQSGAVKVSRRFTELIRQHAGHGVSRGE